MTTLPPPRTSPWTLARSLVSTRPHHVATHASEAARRFLAEEVERGAEAVLAHYLYFAPCLPRRGTASRPRCLLDQQNVDHEVWETYADGATNPTAAWYFRRQGRLIERFERAHLQDFDVVLSVSERDATVTRELVRGAESTRVVVAANGVDLERIRPGAARGPGATPTVLFTGTSARRNVEGLRWFVTQCWSDVRARIPGARFVVAGRMDASELPASLRDDPSVTVTGPVERIEDALAAADVAVVPVRMGGGTKIKVVEAMAAGLPTVLTPEAAIGLDVVDGVHALVRDDPAAYVAAVVDLLVDAALRRRLGEAARAHAERHHDWDAIAATVERELHAVAAPLRTPSAGAVRHPDRSTSGRLSDASRVERGGVS